MNIKTIKNKLNDPDVEITTTYNNSDKPETITINTTIPSKLFKDIYLPIAPNQPKPTIEQIKKEWEDLGYKWIIPKEYPHMIYLINDDDDQKWVLTIKINHQSKRYWKLWGDMQFESFTFQEHQLLTKTFIALDWSDK